MKTEPQLFKPNRLKNVMLFLACSAFVAMGILIRDSNPKIAWACIAFFGLGVIVSIIHFLPNSTYLKLTDEGFEVKGLFRSGFTKWTDVKDFRVGSVKGNKMIFFDYTENHKKWKSGKQVAKFLSGNEGAVQSSYNIKTDELLNLMKKYKLNSEKSGSIQ